LPFVASIASSSSWANSRFLLVVDEVAFWWPKGKWAPGH
jgi:hypothetical protein